MFQKLLWYSFYIDYQVKYEIYLLLHLFILLIEKLPEIMFIEDDLSYHTTKLTNQLT